MATTTSRNDITGALIKSKAPNDNFLNNFGNIKFGVLAAEEKAAKERSEDEKGEGDE